MMRAAQTRKPVKAQVAPASKSKGGAIGTVGSWFAALRSKALSFTRSLLS